MATLKTRPSRAPVGPFLDALPPDRRRECRALSALMRRVSGARPVMWGTSIVGFGHYEYRYPSGRTGDWFPIGFSPRRRDLTIYLLGGLDGSTADLRRLGPHRTGVGCLYVKRVEDIDLAVLERVIRRSISRLAASSHARLTARTPSAG